MRSHTLAVAALLLGFCTNSALVTDVEGIKTLPANQMSPTPPANQTSPTPPANQTSPTPPVNQTSPTPAPSANQTTNLMTVLTPTTVAPTLSPTPSRPKTGHYNVSKDASPCILVQLGVQFVIKWKTEHLYFNVPPRSTETVGQCGQHLSWITLKFSGGFVNFTFVKDGTQYYVSGITAALRSKDDDYKGRVEGLKLFKASVGHSYRCQSKQVVSLPGGVLQIRTVHTWLQAFNIKDGKFGSAVEDCYADDDGQAIPILVGIIMGVLVLSILIAYVVTKGGRNERYRSI